MSDLIDLISLKSLFGPARDQGLRPTCLAFAASDAHAALRSGWSPLSCEYAFFQAQKHASRSPSTGALLPSMLEALRTSGQPEEVGWPYLPATPSAKELWQPPSDISELFRRKSRLSTSKVDDIIAELDQGRPVIVLLMLSSSFFQPSGKGIVDEVPGELPEPRRRHAVVALGHGTIDGQRAVLIRNSWGASWGEDGNGWLTEQFLNPRIFATAVLTEEVHVPANSTTA